VCQDNVLITVVSEDDGSRSKTFPSHGTDGPTDAMQLVMGPKKEPVKIGNVLTCVVISVCYCLVVF